MASGTRFPSMTTSMKADMSYMWLTYSMNASTRSTSSILDIKHLKTFMKNYPKTKKYKRFSQSFQRPGLYYSFKEPIETRKTSQIDQDNSSIT
jgi:hypothetical protein